MHAHLLGKRTPKRTHRNPAKQTDQKPTKAKPKNAHKRQKRNHKNRNGDLNFLKNSSKHALPDRTPTPLFTYKMRRGRQNVIWTSNFSDRLFFCRVFCVPVGANQKSKKIQGKSFVAKNPLATTPGPRRPKYMSRSKGPPAKEICLAHLASWLVES